MRKIVFPLILIVGAIVAYAFYGLLRKDIVISIDESVIQEQIAAKFPVEKSYLVLTISLTNPKVTLRDDVDGVLFGMDVNATVPLQPPATGSAVMSGRLNYDREQGFFYLDQFEVVELKVPELPEKYTDQAKDVLGLVGQEVLNRYPIYRLDEADRQEALARMFLKSVRVEGGKLKVTMGLQENAAQPAQ